MGVYLAGKRIEMLARDMAERHAAVLGVQREWLTLSRVERAAWVECAELAEKTVSDFIKTTTPPSMR